FLTSVEIPFLLSLVLAFGNYLNGGKNEKRLGQADGFHVELLGRPGGLDVVNDAQGCNLRQLIFTVYCEKHQGRAEQLLRELAPMFGLVQRRLGKDAQGVPQIRKSVRVQIEELDKQLMQLKSEFSARHQELKDGLKQISDPADKFVVEVPPEFERARQQVEDLVRQKDTVVQQFKLVLANFKAETYRGDSVIVDGQVKDGNPKEEMTSDVWCKIWDDFFVPGERVLTFDEKRQKELIEPHFCKDSPLTVESLAILW
ncbi:Fmn1, partial [Symbiodinium sp. KB8]